MRKVDIYAPLLSKIEERLIRKIYKKLRRPRSGRKTECLWVEIMSRVGKKAKKLFLLYLDKDKKTLPYVVKVATKQNADAEFKAIQFIEQYISDARHVITADGYDKHGALLFPHRGDIELHEIAYKLYDKKKKVDELVNSFDDIYQGLCRKAHETAQLKDIELLKSYKWYLRGCYATERIKSVLGGNAKKRQFCFLSAQIFNPLIALRKLPSRFTCNVGPVHGDLHPKNIIFNRQMHPGLIDFAWSRHQRHILVDFVLLENSLRFFIFPKCYNLEEQLKIDKLLLHEKGYLQIINCSFSTKKCKQLYLRLASMVQKIRENARRVAGAKYTFNEYLLSQFIVLYGLLKFDEYAIYTALRALGLIANKLFRKGYLK